MKITTLLSVFGLTVAIASLFLVKARTPEDSTPPPSYKIIIQQTRDGSFQVRFKGRNDADDCDHWITCGDFPTMDRAIDHAKSLVEAQKYLQNL